MNRRAFLPFLFLPSHAVARSLGRDVDRAAVMALRAVLRHRRGIEVAHQQIRFAGHDLAFSSRIASGGDLVIDLDIGDPGLADRLVLEDDLRRSARQVRGVAGEPRRR